MPLHVIITGPVGSGKTTLFHKLIKSNTVGTFSVMLDSVDLLNQLVLPPEQNWIITTQSIDNTPQHIKLGALVINARDVRNL